MAAKPSYEIIEVEEDQHTTPVEGYALTKIKETARVLKSFDFTIRIGVITGFSLIGLVVLCLTFLIYNGKDLTSSSTFWLTVTTVCGNIVTAMVAFYVGKSSIK